VGIYRSKSSRSFLFESAGTTGTIGRFSFVGTSESSSMEEEDGQPCADETGEKRRTTSDALVT
jgi:hypothetical protein